MLIKKKKLSRKQSSPKSEWNEEQQHVDTVVFVHGILGNETGTWGEFPHLLHTDRDLPKLDILCWGYRSDVVPRRYQDIETEGEALISDLETLVEEGNDLYLVGHSMGGLVILKGLVNRIRNEHGSTHPVNAVRWITLYSSPLLGSAVANVVSFTISAIPVLRQLMKWLPGNQLYDLRRGDFVEQLALPYTHKFCWTSSPPLCTVVRWSHKVKSNAVSARPVPLPRSAGFYTRTRSPIELTWRAVYAHIMGSLMRKAKRR